MQSEEPLFRRAICMSGSTLIMRPLPAFIHELNYKTVLETISLAHLSPAERIRALLNMPSHELIEKLPPSVALLPLLDEDFISSSLTFAGIEQ